MIFFWLIPLGILVLAGLVILYKTFNRQGQLPAQKKGQMPPRE